MMRDARLPEPLYNNRANLIWAIRAMTIAIKRVFEPASRRDGTRVLVDRLWPRGLTKEKAAVDEWLRDLAPSNDLRHWYHARPSPWDTFRKKYLKELAQPACEEDLSRLYELAGKSNRLTL